MFIRRIHNFSIHLKLKTIYYDTKNFEPAYISTTWTMHSKRIFFITQSLNLSAMNMGDYLRAQVASMAIQPVIGPTYVNDHQKLIFVNGHYFEDFKSLGPTEGGKPYWEDGDSLEIAAASYFLPTNWETKWVDGSVTILLDAADIKTLGTLFATTYYNYLTSNSNVKMDIYLVGHSQGSPYAAGIAEYLKSKGHAIREIIFLAPYQGRFLNPFPSKFSIDPTIVSRQLIYAAWKTGWIGHWIAVDPIVGDMKVINVTKRGVALTNLDIEYLHGSPRETAVFDKLLDLRQVGVVNLTSITTHKPWHDQTPTNHGTTFYSINGIKIDSNDPDWNATNQSY